MPKGFTPSNFKDLRGMRFGNLVVKEIHSRQNWKLRYVCQCDCGKERVVMATNLKTGNTKSCGCVPLQKTIEKCTKHNMTETKAWNTWSRMKSRCMNPNTIGYKYYGAKGITVCERWLESFENFFADMGLPPSPKHSIDRINGDGNYEPSNCRWATSEEQNRNRKGFNVEVTINGKTQCLAAWAKEMNIDPRIISGRRYHGWSDEEAILTPLRKW